MNNFFPKKIYAILDYQFLRKQDFKKVAESYLISGINLIEVKILNTTDNIIFEIINDILELKKKYIFAIILYGRIDIVKMFNLDGIHLDQTDMLSVTDAKKQLPENKIITKGCYSYSDAIKAWKDGVSYIIIGPFFSSDSEKHMGHYDYLKISTLKDILKEVDIPVVAFGGINLSNINSIIDTKVDAVAIVSNIFRDVSPFEKVETFISLFDKNYKKRDVTVINYSDEILKHLIIFFESHFSDYLNVKIKDREENNDLIIFCVSEENIIKLSNENIKNSIIFTDINTHLFREKISVLGSLALLSIKEKIQLDIFESIIWDIINK